MKLLCINYSPKPFIISKHERLIHTRVDNTIYDLLQISIDNNVENILHTLIHKYN